MSTEIPPNSETSTTSPTDTDGATRVPAEVNFPGPTANTFTVWVVTLPFAVSGIKIPPFVLGGSAGFTFWTSTRSKSGLIVAVAGAAAAATGALVEDISRLIADEISGGGVIR